MYFEKIRYFVLFQNGRFWLPIFRIIWEFVVEDNKVELDENLFNYSIVDQLGTEEQIK